MQRCATTWRCWRPRATSPNRTPARAGCPLRRGYREFVNRIDDVKPLSTSGAARDPAVPGVRRGSRRRPRRAVRLLAQLTRQVAIVQYPTLSTSTVRHLEVVVADPARLLMVVITDRSRRPAHGRARRHHRRPSAGAAAWSGSAQHWKASCCRPRRWRWPTRPRRTATGPGRR